jgi:hypothetical protein
MERSLAMKKLMNACRLQRGKLAEREGFEPFCRLGAKSGADADFIEY